MSPANTARRRAIEGRLGRETTIWISTVNRHNVPSLVPVWYVWVEGTLFFFVSSESRQYFNLRVNQSVAASLPDPDQVIIIEGEAHTADHGTLQEIANYFFHKYEYNFLTDTGSDWRLFQVTPHRILAWGDGYDDEGIEVA